MFASIRGTKLFFDVEGMGYVPDGPGLKQKPVCFVLHGGPGGTHTIYKPRLSPLAEHMQLVYIDNRGSGFSEKGPQSSYSLDNNGDDLEALRQYLGLEKIVLFGQSYGGMVALSYAVKYPENVEALFLVTTTPSYRFIEGAKRVVAEKGTPEQQQMAQLVWDGAFTSDEQLTRFYEVMAPLYSYTYKPTPPEEVKPVGNRLVSKRSREALNEGFGGFLRSYDVIDSLGKITAPTLIIGARHDWITPVEESFVIADHIPDNELVIFENSSHSVFKDQYALFLSTTLGFIERKIMKE